MYGTSTLQSIVGRVSVYLPTGSIFFRSHDFDLMTMEKKMPLESYPKQV